MSAGPAPELGSPWAFRLGPENPAAPKLICLPYAGGNAHAFRPLANLLSERAEVHGIQLPGRGMRLSEPPLTSVYAVVEALEGELEHLVDGAFAFLGTSMGALLAFEWARALRRRGAGGPLFLYALGARPPHLADPDWRIHDLPDDAFQLALRRYGGTPTAVLEEPELMELMLPMLRADFAVVETYVHRPEPPLAVPVVAFGGWEDAVVPPPALAGWARHTSAAYRERLFPGSHFFYRAEDVQAEIAATLTAELDRRVAERER